MDILSTGVFCIVMLSAAAVLLYLLMIMPHLSGRRRAELFESWLYAHRGLYDNGTDAPENSLKAFQRAVDAGFGIELDIQLSRDGIPVVFHDFTLKRICGAEGRVCDYTYKELQQFALCGSEERIPRLQDVLLLVRGQVPLIIELKIERTDISLCAAADRLLSRYQGSYCIESFNPLGVLWYRRHRGGVVRGQLADAFLKEGEYVGVLYFVLQNLLLNFLTKPDFIAYNHKYPNILSRKLCRGLYSNPAAAWTVKSEEELKLVGRHFDLFIFDSFIPEQRGSERLQKEAEEKEQQIRQLCSRGTGF